MKNACFIGAMTSELMPLEELLGKGETVFKQYDNKNDKIKIIPEDNVLYKTSKNLSLGNFTAYEKNTKIPVTVITNYENNVSIVNSGVGMYNAFCSAKCIDQNQYNHIINIGVVGAINKDLKLGELLNVKNVFFEDEDKNFFYNNKLQEFDDLKKVNLLSSLNFLNQNIKKKFIELNKINKIKMDVCDMELFALREVIPTMYSFKVVSDEYNHGIEDFKNNFFNIIDNYYKTKIQELFF